MRLTFNILRIANRIRLPLFKNKAGVPAHTDPMGADWSVAQWVQALVGEIGEFCTLRIGFENGVISEEEYTAGAAKELADIATYLDILAQRALDHTVVMHMRHPDAAQLLMAALGNIGEYANDRKKFDRKDTDAAALEMSRHTHLETAMVYLRGIRNGSGQGVNNETTVVHPQGVDLGAAIVEKFNEVSTRVNADVMIENEGRLVVANGCVGVEDPPFDNEAQAYAFDAMHQLVPELKCYENNVVVLTPAHAEKLLRAVGWTAPCDKRLGEMNQ